MKLLQLPLFSLAHYLIFCIDWMVYYLKYQSFNQMLQNFLYNIILTSTCEVLVQFCSNRRIYKENKQDIRATSS